MISVLLLYNLYCIITIAICDTIFECVLFLIYIFINTATIICIFTFHFIAIIYILIYIGALAVLFVFSIMCYN